MISDVFVDEKRARTEAKALLDATDEAMQGMIEEYLWYRFLREVVGIALLTPEEIEAASLLQPRDARNEVRGKYEAGFRLWLACLERPTDYLARFNRWYESYLSGTYAFEPLAGYVEKDAGVLDVSVYISYGKPYEDEKYCVSIELAKSLNELYTVSGLDKRVTLAEFEGKNVTEACEWIRAQVPKLGKYARMGYAPITSLPSAGTLRAKGWFNPMVTPYQPKQSKRHWLRDYPERAAWI